MNQTTLHPLSSGEAYGKSITSGCASLPLNAYMQVLAAHLPEKIIAPQKWGILNAFIARLPLLHSNNMGFEYPLNAKSPRTDFSLSVDPAIDSREQEALLLLDDWIREQPFHPALATWQCTAAFARNWAEPDTLLNKTVAELWLEFDINAEKEFISIPLVFLVMRPLEHNNPGGEDLDEVFRQAADRLCPAVSCKQEIAANIRICQKHLPQGSRIVQLGIMTGRNPFFARVLVDIAPGLIPAYLQAIGWQGDKKRAAELLDDLERLTNKVVLALDVGIRIEDKIGFECFQAATREQTQSPWLPFFEYLTACNLCCAGEKNDLLNFKGFCKKEQEAGTEFKGDTYIHWTINHIKIEFGNTALLKAKAYICLTNLVITPDESIYKERKSSI